jgi:SAM-dependent methyltransferase
MSDLIALERSKYADVWTSVSAYGERSPGEQMLPVFESMRRDGGGPATVLDAGCGAGRGALALHRAGHTVTCCDTTDAGLAEAARIFPFVTVNLWDDLRDRLPVHDYVYCCDVLEHIPLPFTMLVVARLLEVARHGVFLSISTIPDQFGAWAGTSLHLSVQPFVEWRDQLNAVGRVVEARDLLIAGAYLVEHR